MDHRGDYFSASHPDSLAVNPYSPSFSGSFTISFGNTGVWSFGDGKAGRFREHSRVFDRASASIDTGSPKVSSPTLPSPALPCPA